MPPPGEPPEKPAEGEQVVDDEDGNPLVVGKPLLDGNGVKDAVAATPEQGLGQWIVNVDFNGEGRGGWRQLVSDACANQEAGQRVAILLDDKVISSPGVVPELCASGGGTSTSITGNFTQAAAKDLAMLIKGGALPVPVEVIEQRTVGPDARRRRDQGVDRGGDHRHHPDRPVHPVRLPAGRAARDDRARHATP